MEAVYRLPSFGSAQPPPEMYLPSNFKLPQIQPIPSRNIDNLPTSFKLPQIQSSSPRSIDSVSSWNQLPKLPQYEPTQDRPFVSSSGRNAPSPPSTLRYAKAVAFTSPSIRRSPPLYDRYKFNRQIVDLLAERYPDIFEELATDAAESNQDEYNDLS